MKYAYFPGCSAHSTGIAYTQSYSYVAERVGIELEEIPDWNCCGAGEAELEGEMLAAALPARSLAIAEETYGDREVLAPCAGCYQRLKRTSVQARRDEDLKGRIEDTMGRSWAASAEVLNGLEPFVETQTHQALKDHAVAPLNGLKVACYYGCALLRPVDISQFDDEERPHTMEDILSSVGAKPISWSFHNECCGAGHHIGIPGTARTMTRRILENAAANGADVIACACPLCMLNLDMRESTVNEMRAAEGLPPINLPICYFTELIALAFGATAEESGLNRHFFPAMRLADFAGAPVEEPEENPKSRRASSKSKATEKEAVA